MAALSKKNFRLWGYGKVFVLFAGCLLFSVSGRLNEGIYFEQHILSAVSDHYYLTCFLLPVLLLSCLDVYKRQFFSWPPMRRRERSRKYGFRRLRLQLGNMWMSIFMNA